jgi:hypothetical protein
MVELQIVILAVAGSSPVGYPTLFWNFEEVGEGKDAQWFKGV